MDPGSGADSERRPGEAGELLALPREGNSVSDPEPIDPVGWVEDHWADVETADAPVVAGIDWRTGRCFRGRLLDESERNRLRAEHRRGAQTPVETERTYRVPPGEREDIE